MGVQSENKEDQAFLLPASLKNVAGKELLVGLSMPSKQWRSHHVDTGAWATTVAASPSPHKRMERNIEKPKPLLMRERFTTTDLSSNQT
ncbi:hypothetical protein U1Q18_019863 [Sarracenia purpurea var. burkii]